MDTGDVIVDSFFLHKYFLLRYFQVDLSEVKMSTLDMLIQNIVELLPEDKREIIRKKLVKNYEGVPAFSLESDFF